MDKILFICEGETTERKFCNLIIEKYFIKRKKVKEYVAFGTNIYGLYDEIIKDKDLDIVELIKERALKVGDNNTYNKLSQGGFAETYLIFDFDPQAPQADINKIKEMIKLFNNETEYGKLYINYPMMESFKHFKSLPDDDYNTYEVVKNDCLTYKRDVSNITIINHFTDVDNEKLAIIIKQNISKYEYLSHKKMNNYDKYKSFFSQYKLLLIQIRNLNKNNKIYVFNTSVFWGIDYFGKEKYLLYYNSI